MTASSLSSLSSQCPILSSCFFFGSLSFEMRFTITPQAVDNVMTADAKMISCAGVN
ncbi:hypothetical protein [uncultured Methanobrevibacter sp.]|uniref:hypothetical protein n=1 Tax=uncultured Methanobrevibacter sp. TaxID=253161 RepID=UPI00261C2EB1|nr:hypothetical protein [uncultured Methanobrevibacter sp.]